MPNIVTTPRKWKSKAVLIKPETTYGVDTVPTGAANWIEGRNVQLTPMDVDKVDRNIELPFMGSSGSVLVGFWSKLSMDIALAPSGTAGVAPKWGPLLLACGFAETVTATTSVAYNLVSKNQGSAICYMNIDGVLHKLLGMRGSVKCKCNAKSTPMLSLSFDAVYATPILGAPPTVVKTGWMIEEGVNSANTGPMTLNGVDMAFSTFEWDIANKMGRIDLPGPQKEITITDRAPSASIMVLAPDLATFNPFVLAEASTTVPLTTVHGSAAGKKTQTDMHVRITGVEYDQIEGNLAYKLTLEPVPVVGNDEVALTCL